MAKETLEPIGRYKLIAPYRKDNTPERIFKQKVMKSANTGHLIKFPGDLTEEQCISIMQEVAGELIDQGQAIKAVIILDQVKSYLNSNQGGQNA